MNKNKMCVREQNSGPKGITLIALIITIILMLILATVTVNVGINGGLFEYAGSAKDSVEVASEKEAIQKSFILAKGTSKTGRVTVQEMQKAVDKIVKENTVSVIDNDETIVVKFNESNRCYEVDSKGNVKGPTYIVNDEYAGEITKGEALDGSSEKPYEINCIEDLVAFSIMSNGGNAELGLSSNAFTDKYVKLMRTLNFNSIFSYNDYETTKYGDLNADGTVENIKTELTKTVEGCVGFTPINNFGGYFDGQGNEIQNIYIKREGSAALFTATSKTIKNVGVTGEIISTTTYAAGINTGGSTTIENCWNKAKVTGALYGAAGISTGSVSIKNCYNEGDITNTSTQGMGYGMAGGIATGCGRTIVNCYNTGDIKGTGYVGGIVSGHSNGTTSVKNCYNTGEVQGGNAGGGILGCVGGTIENCYNTGDIQGNSYAGGIVGTEATEIKNCYNTGTVKGTYIGGICSLLEGTVVNCYNLGTINGGRVGGIAGIAGQNGTSKTMISNCFNIGDIICAGYDGFSGRNIRKKY